MTIIDNITLDNTNYTIADGRINDLIELKNVSDNIINPADFKKHTYQYSLLDGTVGDNRTNCQTTELIDVGAHRYLYFYNNQPTDVHELYVFEYGENGISDYKAFTRKPTSLSSFTLTLNLSTKYVAFETTAPEATYNTANLCVSYVELDGYEPYEEGWVLKDTAETATGSLGSTLYRKRIAFFGDSILENGRVVPRFASLTGSICANFAKGGTSASHIERPLSLCTIARAISTEEWSTFIANANAVDTRMGALATRISQYDYSACDAMVFHFGSNDSYDGSDNASDPLDTSYFNGAIRYSIETIQTKYPQIRIFVSNVINSLNQSKPYRAQAMAKLKEICDEYHVGYIDNFTNFGINDTTASVLLASDSIHLSEIGQYMLADHFAHNMW